MTKNEQNTEYLILRDCADNVKWKNMLSNPGSEHPYNQYDVW